MVEILEHLNAIGMAQLAFSALQIFLLTFILLVVADKR